MFSRHRSAIAAAGVGVFLVASAPGTAQAADPVYPPALKSVKCSAKAVSSATKIKVDMGPNLSGSGHYTFRLDKKLKGVWVRQSKQYKTQGKGETRTVNVGKGKWRAECEGTTQPISASALDAKSNSVSIKN